MLGLMWKEAITRGVNQQFEVPQEVDTQDRKFDGGTQE
jgi:hypothetical protein